MQAVPLRYCPGFTQNSHYCYVALVAIYLQRCSSSPPPRAGCLCMMALACSLGSACEVGASAACLTWAGWGETPGPLVPVISPRNAWLSARRNDGFIPPLGPVSLPAPCHHVRSRYQRCWTTCESHRLQQCRCPCNYCCCFSSLKACQAPNAACHFSSASQASTLAGKDSPVWTRRPLVCSLVCAQGWLQLGARFFFWTGKMCPTVQSTGKHTVFGSS